MAEWLVEEGIGEHRALLVDSGRVMAAKLHWPGELHAGLEARAKLVAKPSGGRRGMARLENGEEVLVDHLPPELSEGTGISLTITRAPVAERGRFKRATGRFLAVGKLARSGQAPFPEGRRVRRFPAGLWEDVWSAASGGTIDFPSGQIIVCPTPAMTLIDVDGPDKTVQTAIASVAAVAQAINWFDLGGSIGIDFPTVEAKADRKAVDAALDEALDSWPHERTSMNGFGFVQIVARLEGPSLLHRFQSSRVGACARMALRSAEMVEGTGPVLLLTIHPALKAKLKPDWLAELARRTGKEVRIETSPGLALEAPHAQLVSS